jgi:hypothetical protein
MSYKVIHRVGQPGNHRFDGFPFGNLDEAVRFASNISGDFVIEEAAHGVLPPAVVKYRLGEFEMG